MSEDQVAIDDAVETQDGTDAGFKPSDLGLDASSGQADTFADQQNRMEGDEPWFSPSAGRVVDKDGNVLYDPATGKEFESKEEFDAWMAKQAEVAKTAKPENKDVKKEAVPMSKSFDSYAKGEGDFTPERLAELAKAGSDYKYADELLPRVDATKAAADEKPPVDPVEAVKANRANWEAVAVNPIKEMRQMLIDNGINQEALDRLISPIMQKQAALVENQYQTAYEKAMLEKVEGKFSPALSKLEEEKQTNLSDANIDRLSRAYFPQGGKDQFFALVNGYKDEKGQFVRGPAASILDVMVNIATGGKTFSSEQERASAYQNTFKKITADGNMSKMLFDLAYKYWLGGQVGVVNKLGFKAGQAAATADQQRIKKTIKTKPASYQAPANAPDDKDMPDMLRGAMSFAGGGRR
jgi:hypothetical protein